MSTFLGVSKHKFKITINSNCFERFHHLILGHPECIVYRNILITYVHYVRPSLFIGPTYVNKFLG